MNHTDTILVIVDPEARHHAALAKGALLARKYQASLQLLAWSNAGGQHARTLRTDASRKLQILARCLSKSGLNVSTETVPVDSLNAVLAERLNDNRASFIIKDVPQGSAIRAEVLSAGELALTRMCRVPLLLSKSTLWPELPGICVVLDPDEPRSALDDAVMKQSRTLADRLDGQLHVLHSPAPARLRTAGEDPNLRGSGALRTDRAVDRAVDRVVDSYIGGLSELRLKCSVLVMGAPSPKAAGEDAVEGLLAGLLKRIRCDMLLVKAPPVRRSFH